jgi:hypothetical protein
VWPKNCQVVLQRFDKKTAAEHEEAEQVSAITPNNWIALEQLLCSAVADVRSLEMKKLGEKLHHYQVENNLLKNENQGLCNPQDKEEAQEEGLSFRLATA